MDSHAKFVVFTLDAYRYALSLDAVEEVFRAAAITPLPEAPEPIAGVVDLCGHILAVLDLRKRFHLPSRPPQLEDQFIKVAFSGHSALLLVDRTLGVFDIPDHEMTGAAQILVEGRYVRGVAPLQGELIVINDLASLLTEAESGFAKRVAYRRERHGKSLKSEKNKISPFWKHLSQRPEWSEPCLRKCAY